MQIAAKKLIDDLLEIVNEAKNAAVKFRNFRTDQLNYKPGPEAWSILECIEHLNLYGDYYLPEIEKNILAQESPVQNTVFKSGFLGNYFAKLMQVKNGTITKKLKSPKDKNPINSKLKARSIERFLEQLDLLERLLNESREVDLVRTRTAISLTKIIKLRLGDTFRFFVYHIERHILQANKIEIGMNRRVLV